MKLPMVVLDLAAGVMLVSCSRGGGADPPGSATGAGDFVVLQTMPTNGGRIFLNDAVTIDFSNPVDLDSANLTTVSFLELDQQGHPVSDLVSGTFRLAASPGDASIGRRLQFVPRFADDNDYSNGGFRAGRNYLVQLVGGSASSGTVLRDSGGKALRAPVTFAFGTVEGSQAAQLYRNPKSGGPRRSALEVTTAKDLASVPLNLFGAPPVEVRLHFDQALNPSDVNVPVHFDTNPAVRDQGQRGRIYLEYADTAVGPDAYVWIPADVALEQNDLNGAVVVLRPIGVLPNNATVRVIVENTLEDISGESNVASLDHDPVFGEFHTSAAYGQQWNGIAEDFADADQIDFGAAFPEAQAEVGPGFVRAGFAFEGNPTSLEYEPTTAEVVLNTAFTQITPKNGLSFSVTGGVFHFKNVRIPQGVSVVGQGPNPMVWLCSGDFTVEGTLSVRGGDGARAETTQAANVAKAGGIGVCGGGSGGEGSPKALQRDVRGGQGRGPLQVPGKGGRGGYIACTGGCFVGGDGGGSGGGGGTLATQGDPYYRGELPTTPVHPNLPPTGNTRFQQMLGYGGAGCGGMTGQRSAFLNGGEPGDRVFVDSRADNDFWGSAIRLSPTGNLRITGELTVPVGGGGGGGGGDSTWSGGCEATGDPTFDYSAGGGGGGGGAVIVKALGRITVSGRITADGGNGGGGEALGSCGWAGGGGGGAGGMVVLMSAREIVLVAHGSPADSRFAYGPTVGLPSVGQRDYDFVVSADGGVTRTSAFGSVIVTGKYPAGGATMIPGQTYDDNPLGGLGGLGLVQLMVPPGDNGDGTNTRLDDHITVLMPTTGGNLVPATPAQKQALLAWRGFPGAGGVMVDDHGVPTGITDNEGDIRPAPVLLPVPFSAKSRLRSRWIDTGASRRRVLSAADGHPAGVVGGVAGPVYEFAGLSAAPGIEGYADYAAAGSGAAVVYPLRVERAPIAAIETGATYLGALVHRVTLATAPLGENDRYVQHEAELLNVADAVVGSFRIVHHTADELLLDAASGVLPGNATQLQVRAKFFRVTVQGSEGLGSTYSPVGSLRTIPNANVRIGFAFHQDPKVAGGRFPAEEQAYLYDLQDPAFLQWVGERGAPRYVCWDVTFDLTFAHDSLPPSLRPDTPRLELRFLRLPFHF